MEGIRQQTKEVLDSLINDTITANQKLEVYEHFKDFINSMKFRYHLSIIILECANYKHKQGLKYITSNSKDDRKKALHNKELITTFLELAQDIFNIKED